MRFINAAMSRYIVLILIVILLVPPVYAQTATTPSIAPATSLFDFGPQQDKKWLELPKLKPENEPELVLPLITPPESEKKGNLSALPCVFVRKFVFEGNTAFPDEELAEIAAPYTNRSITFEELQEVRQKLTLHYVEKGYISSGVVIPDQPVENGIIILSIIEGKLIKIVAKSTGRLRPGYIISRLKLAEGPPVNIFELQEALQLLQQDPNIKKIDAQLGPGDLIGESILHATVEEQKHFSLLLESSNDHSPSIGEYGGNLRLSYQNLTGFGDSISATGGLTEGSDDYGIHYAIPVTAYGTTLSLQYNKSESVIVEELFEDLDIESRFEVYGITVSHPLYKTAQHTITFGITGERKHGESYLLGRRFSFSPGEENGKSDVTVPRFFQEWVNRDMKQVIAVRSTISRGINALDATVNSEMPDGEFLTWLGQFQWIRRFGDTGFCDVILKTDAQLTPDPLLPLEKFSVGGMNSVRGYRKNRLVRDNGVTTSLEVRVPVIRNKKGEAVVELAPFFDYGMSWNSDSDTSDSEDIPSSGIGVRWAITQKVHLQVYGAKAFREFDNEDDSLQDMGLHFNFTAELF